MRYKKPFNLILLLLIVILNIGCDQLSKTIVRDKIGYNENIEVIENHFMLTKVENTGAFLSTGNDLPDTLRFLLLNILPSVILIYGLYYLIVKKDLPRTMQIGLSFLIGGGIGNVYDRVIHGSVTDFMHLDFVIFRTGIFNFADISIMIGIGILLFHSLSLKLKYQ